MQPHSAGDVKQQALKAQIHAKHYFTVHALATLKTHVTNSWTGEEVIPLKKLQAPISPSGRAGDNPSTKPFKLALCLACYISVS